MATLCKMVPSGYQSLNMHCAWWRKCSAEVIRPHEGLCLLEKFSTPEGKTSAFLVADSSVPSSVFAQSSAQPQLKRGWVPLYFDYKFLSGLPKGSYTFLIVLTGRLKSGRALESESPGLRSSSSISYWHITLNKLLNLSKAQFSHLLKGDNNSTYF